MAATHQLVLSLIATAYVQGHDVSTSPSAQLNNAATKFLSQGRVDNTSGIACFADGAQGSFGICSQLTLEDTGDAVAVSVGADVVFNSNITQHVSVATFGAIGAAVVCYSDAGGTQRVTCRVLDVSSRQLSDPVEVSGEATLASSVSVASVGDSKALVCFSFAGSGGADAPEGQCAALFVISLLSSVQLLAGAPVSFGTPGAATEISVHGFDEDLAVVCCSQAGQGACTHVKVAGSAVNYASTQVLASTDGAGGSAISIAKLTEESGVVCFARYEADANHAVCSALAVNDSALGVGSALGVSTGNSSSVSVAPLSSGLALVCYVDLSDSASVVRGAADDVGGPGACRLLSVDGLQTSAGPASVVNDEPTAHLVLAGFTEDVATMCYSNQRAGHGFCVALSIDPIITTTASALTTTQASSTAASETMYSISTPYATETTVTRTVSSTFLGTSPEPAQGAKEYSGAGPQLVLVVSIRLLALVLGVGALY